MRALILLSSLVLTSTAAAAVQTESVSYTVGENRHVGYLAYDDAADGARPGVLVIPEWWGLNDYAKRRVRQLADMGYVAFAADMYGGGRTTTDADQAEAWSSAAEPHLRKLAQAGLDVLAGRRRVNPEHLAAIGFCFGGTSVLQLAYSGTDIDGVVSFHGHLPTPDEGDTIDASILVLHGAADPFVPPADVTAFKSALGDRTSVDWHLTAYSGAEHAFTNPEADNAGLDGVAYDKTAARRSWAHMQLFLDSLFQDSTP